MLNRAPLVDGKPLAPRNADEMEILPGVPEALAQLAAAGFALVVVTNQPEIARGTVTWASVNAINVRLNETLPIDEFRVCPHDDADNCPCRKPKPGLLLDPPTYAVAQSYLVGDRWRDIDAGCAAGCRATILVDYQYPEGIRQEPDVRVRSLAEAAEWILHDNR